MNIRSEILKEHSKKQTIKIAAYVGNNAKRFSELMSIFFKDEHLITQRSAWVVSYCVQAHPELIKPYLKEIVTYLQKPVHDAVKRNIVRILQNMEIPKGLRGRLANSCFHLLSSPKEAVAIKVFSMSVLFNLSKTEPGLSNELRIIIEDQLPYASAGFLSRGKKILNNLK
jgi:hypothetical protein